MVTSKKCLLNQILIILIFGIICIQYSFSQNAFRIYPSGNIQVEPIICVSPLNPQILFGSATTRKASFSNTGVYVTSNGGLNWYGRDTLPNTGIPSPNGGDPGVAIDNHGVLLLTHVGYNFLNVYGHYSTDMGVTWSNGYLIFNGQADDKGTLTSDNIPTSPYYGRAYVIFDNYTVSTPPVMVSYTSNSGLNWSNPLQINNPTRRCTGCSIKTGLAGKVYAAWVGMDPSFPPYETFTGFSKSTNGGVSWSTNDSIFNMHGIFGHVFSCIYNVTLNGYPKLAVDVTSGPRSGYVYIATGEYNNAPAGTDPDIVFHRSTDDGQTWSSGIRVNQDAVNNGKNQFFPSICVDTGGGINVLYYDNRNYSCDSSYDLYISRSTNGGNSWQDYKISDQSFKPHPVPGSSVYWGDFITMIAVNNKLFATWMADYTGSYQAWMKIIDIGTIGIKQINSHVPKNYTLSQNYPNPFNPSTTIEFSIPKRGNVKLLIFDAQGKEISTLINSLLEPGTYRTDFDAANISSGVYFYQLITESYSQTKKMIFLK